MKLESQLSKQNTGITQKENEYFESFKGLMLKDISKFEIEKAFFEIIEKTFFDCGQPGKIEDMQVMAADMLSDAKTFFSILTISEIRLAFKLGCRKEYGEYFGLNNVTFFNWIKKYQISEDRKNAKIKLLPPNIEKVLTENEKEEILKNGCLDAFETFKIKGNYHDFGNCTYKFLDKKNIIPFNTERKNQFMEKAWVIVIQAHKDELETKKDSFIRQILLDKIKEIEGNKKDERVISEAMRFALVVFFTELIETGTELKDIL